MQKVFLITYMYHNVRFKKRKICLIVIEVLESLLSPSSGFMCHRPLIA